MNTYATPPILGGYDYVEGEWNNGFVIERKSDGSQFVWVPVVSLAESNQKFESESIKKHSGFYISRYNISKNSQGKPQSIKGELPWINFAYHYIIEIAENMEKNNYVKSHLTYDVEYNLILQWLINSHATSYDDLYKDSSRIGNYNAESKAPATTGSCEEWCLNNIYDFAGNVREFTKITNNYAASRGGAFCDYSYVRTAAFRYASSPLSGFDTAIGFRVVLDVM